MLERPNYDVARFLPQLEKDRRLDIVGALLNDLRGSIPLHPVYQATVAASVDKQWADPTSTKAKIEEVGFETDRARYIFKPRRSIARMGPIERGYSIEVADAELTHHIVIYEYLHGNARTDCEIQYTWSKAGSIYATNTRNTQQAVDFAREVLEEVLELPNPTSQS